MFSRGVVSLPEELHIGVDLRFSKDAYVVIATENIPVAETVK